MEADDLVGAVNKAMERTAYDHFDVFTIHRGCYILNHWGYRPVLSYPKYVKGPYSYDIRKYDSTRTDISDDVIDRLGRILKDERYSIAYCLLLLIRKVNPDISVIGVLRKAKESSPSLMDKVWVAYHDLFDELRCAGMRVHM